jgi:L-alanine-DL-glutamate epimerase-like enolase superfamily enzyme
MPPRLTIRRESWPLEKPFAISRGVKTAAEVIVCEAEENGFTGRGECVPYARYGETPEGVEAQLRAARAPDDLPPGAARNALDCALTDLRAKTSGVRVWQSAGLAAPLAATTAYTISLGTPDAMRAAAAEAAARPLLKVKLGADDPVACMAAVRAGSPHARLIADANEGWSIAQLTAIAHDLAALGVELIEQPLPADADGALEGWDSPLILCADESFHVSHDIAGLTARYGAVNIKLDKAGGFTEALACVRAAEAADLKIMVGCMVATSLAMAPAALLAGAADYVDLDGPLLLKQDRVPGIRFEGSLMYPPEPALWG